VRKCFETCNCFLSCDGFVPLEHVVFGVNAATDSTYVISLAEAKCLFYHSDLFNLIRPAITSSAPPRWILHSAKDRVWRDAIFLCSTTSSLNKASKCLFFVVLGVSVNMTDAKHPNPSSRKLKFWNVHHSSSPSCACLWRNSTFRCLYLDWDSSVDRTRSEFATILNAQFHKIYFFRCQLTA